MSKSLFERAREEEEELHASKKRKTAEDPDDDEPVAPTVKNKAMAMMLKMGFKEGQALGATKNEEKAKADDKGTALVDAGELSGNTDEYAESGVASTP